MIGLTHRQPIMATLVFFEKKKINLTFPTAGLFQTVLLIKQLNQAEQIRFLTISALQCTLPDWKANPQKLYSLRLVFINARIEKNLASSFHRQVTRYSNLKQLTRFPLGDDGSGLRLCR